MFPVEIWEKILHELDALPLLHLCTVNKTWNVIITKHLEKSDAWYRQCEKDIPKKHWNPLLENSFHSSILKKQVQNNNEYDRYESKTWLTLYKAFRKWINVHWFDKYVIEQFNPIPKHRKNERITCCSTLGELVAIGSSEGYIRVFNLKTNKLVFYTDQVESAASIKLWVQGKNHDKIILIVTSHKRTVIVWDIVERKSLRNRRPGYAMCTGLSHYCIGLHGRTVIVYNLTSERNYSIKMTGNFNDFDNYVLENIYNDIYPVNMTLNEDKLSCFYNDGLLCEIDLGEVGEDTVLYKTELIDLGKPEHLKVLNYYLFNPDVAFCITDRGLLGISVYKSKWVFHNTFPFLEGSITAIHYQLSLLAIGLDYGCVCLFSVKNPSGLKKIDFKSSRKIQVTNEPIVSINLMELSGDQRLLVTSSYSFYNIQLGYE